MMTTRAEFLAQRVESAHQQLMVFIENCSQDEWRTFIPVEGRSVGTLIHHVVSVLPIEIDLAKTLASGETISDVTIEAVNQMNAQHAQEHPNPTKEETLGLLKANSAQAVAAIREFSEEGLDQAAPNSLHWGAPLTTQYWIEEHPISHGYHHLTSIREVIGSQD